jgi:mycothiol system anti-sigma-R factor
MDEQDDHKEDDNVGCGAGGSSSPDGTPYDMSQCQEAMHTLYNFLDGELTELRRKEITHHLDECAPCLEAFDFEAELKLVIARKCRDQVPDDLRKRVYRALMDASGDGPSGEYPWE